MDTTKRIINIGVIIFAGISTIILLKDLNPSNTFQLNELDNSSSLDLKSNSEKIEKILNQLVTEKQAPSLGGTLTKKSTSTTTIGSITIPSVIDETNQQRKSHSKGTLIRVSELDHSAEVKANDILNKQYFEHTSPSGITITDLVNDSGYKYLKVGENLALGNFYSAKEVVDAWMASPGHRANILDGAFEEIGIGVAYGKYEGQNVFVIVQHFGRPEKSCPTIDKTILITYKESLEQFDYTEKTLSSIKATIDEGRAKGNLMNDMADQFNELYKKYQIEFDELEHIRQIYNEQVRAFNECLSLQE